MRHLLELMSYGKYMMAKFSHPCAVTWDGDDGGLQIKDMRITIPQFKAFIHEVVGDAQEILEKNVLF
jgi:hypothetical protein